MSSKVLLLVPLVTLACSEGHPGLFGPQDLAVTQDMSVGDMLPDMPAGKTCGEVFMCLLGGLGGGGGGGTGGLGNIGMCIQGVDPMAAQQAIALGICAATNCLGGLIPAPDAGMADPTQTLICVALKCGNEVSNCKGLMFGPGGPM
jgi:hypothetical protein